MTDQKIKILLVDDDKFLREMYITKFTNSGFEVSSAGSGQEAIDKIKEGHDFKILLFDIIMPGMDGWGFIKSVRDQNLLPDAKVIVLSNQGESNDVDKSKEFNVDGYIVKALKTPSEVVEEVNKIYNK